MTAHERLICLLTPPTSFTNDPGPMFAWPDWTDEQKAAHAAALEYAVRIAMGEPVELDVGALRGRPASLLNSVPCCATLNEVQAEPRQ